MLLRIHQPKHDLMAYVVTVEVQNETEYLISQLGRCEYLETPRRRDHSWLPYGATNGDRRDLTWFVGSGHWGSKSQFSVWYMMPASASGEVLVGLADTDCMSADQFRTDKWADYLYDTRG